MCGITGIKRSRGKIDGSLINAMRDTFHYRGPDDKGTWIDQSANIALAHRRLSVLDPSPCGHQPMHDEEIGCHIVFNGEVYNYIEIRKQLIAKGHQFRTGTDTEVILKAYREYGRECLQYFNGMFAFAIWDERNQVLFLARDRLGIKPLYYYVKDDGICIFASEVKAILKALDRSPKINSELIDQYMSFGFVPGAETLHDGIKRLLPGHFAIFSNNTFSIEKYWDLTFHNQVNKGFDYYLSNSKNLLNSAIDLRLRSDVPLGIFLSGGIDSSAVVALLAERVSEPLKTFSIAYDYGNNFNETDYARQVSEQYQTDHHELFITPTQFRDFIPEYIHLMDEPVTESAALSLYFLSKLTKETVTVVLSGEGSDEIFAGYDLYKYMLVIERLRSVIGQDASSLISDLAGKIGVKNKVTKYLAMVEKPIDKRYKGISTYEEYHKKLLYRPEFQQHLSNIGDTTATDKFLQDLFKETEDKDVISRMLYFDIKTWLVDDLLIKADRMSMAASLELRVPFLDYRLVEFAATIPSHYKVRNNQGKYILKKMMEGLLPNNIISRKKMGFPTPLKMMFENDLSDYASDLLLSDNARIANYFTKERVSQLMNEHTSKQHDHHRILWQLVVLEEWLGNNFSK